MKLYGAIDLHSNNSVVVLLDEQDRVVYERRLPGHVKYSGVISEAWAIPI